MDSKATVTEHSSSKDETTTTRKPKQTTTKTLSSVFSPTVPSPGVSFPSVWTFCPTIRDLNVWVPQSW